jgi:SHS2 domain-containing protein
MRLRQHGVLFCCVSHRRPADIANTPPFPAGRGISSQRNRFLKFELLDHPADIGFRAYGRDLAELFENSALALLSIALELDTITPAVSYPVAAEGPDSEVLLVNWLEEVLYLLDGKHIAVHHATVHRISDTSVAGVTSGEPREAHHRARVIVKAVTYHQLRVERTGDTWTAEVYLDI